MQNRKSETVSVGPEFDSGPGASCKSAESNAGLTEKESRPDQLESLHTYGDMRLKFAISVMIFMFCAGVASWAQEIVCPEYGVGDGYLIDIRWVEDRFCGVRSTYYLSANEFAQLQAVAASGECSHPVGKWCSLFWKLPIPTCWETPNRVLLHRCACQPRRDRFDGPYNDSAVERRELHYYDSLSNHLYDLFSAHHGSTIYLERGSTEVAIQIWRTVFKYCTETEEEVAAYGTRTMIVRSVDSLEVLTDHECNAWDFVLAHVFEN